MVDRLRTVQSVVEWPRRLDGLLPAQQRVCPEVKLVSIESLNVGMELPAIEWME